MNPEQANAIRFLGKGGTTGNGCPSVYVTDHGTFLIQGWVTDQPETVEIPHLLIGFVEPDTFIGVHLADTGRGTFRLTGRAVTEPETLAQLDLYEDETAIEVPLRERTFYGVAAAR
ncbi:hypothetical protein HLB23_29525 [Nocardia uniformis]|uniref:Uncharacterized protein n=1 Tax=Nocardia uniformis TaxID=53432 RepID=A0A849C825_9NOCA|nr:hypothetical protein [Nocardia uniformis]NNH73946.1 hypothetical protein [Nocardia uniformis]